MLRASLLLLLAAVCRGHDCHGEQCFAPQDTSGLIQQHKLVADSAVRESGDDDSSWTFENTFFDTLFEKLNPEGITEKISKIIEDNSISLETAQDKLYGLAHKFGTRLNKTMEAAQERIASLQSYLSEQGRMVKDQSLLQAVKVITELGDAAVDVARKVTDEVEAGQLKVRQMVSMLRSEKVESRRAELQQSLDIAVTTLTGLVHALQDTMRRSGDANADLMQLDANASLNASQPELSRAAVDRAEALLKRTDELLDDAKVYIDFVETRVSAAREEAERLVEAAGNQSEAAFDLSDRLAEDVITRLGEIDDMLQGKISVFDAKTEMEHERSGSARAAASLVAGLGALAAMSL